MGLSVGSLGTIGGIGGASSAASITSIRERMYNVSNESQVSEAYTERIRQGAGAADGIYPVEPVQYPNASKTREEIAANRTQQLEDSIAAETAYNSVAERFQGAAAYDSAMNQLSYATAGAHINAYA